MHFGSAEVDLLSKFDVWFPALKLEPGLQSFWSRSRDTISTLTEKPFTAKHQEQYPEKGVIKGFYYAIQFSKFVDY